MTPDPRGRPLRLGIIGGVIGGVLAAHKATPVQALVGIGVGLGLYTLSEKVLEARRRD